MRKTVLRSIAVSAIGLAVSTAWAAELGSLTVYSSVGEPLRAQLTVKDVNPSLSPRVRLAPASIYGRVGKTAVVPVSEMSLKLEGKDPYTLSIVSKNAVHEKTFPLIVELSEGNDRSAKLYNISLKDRPIAAAPKTETKPQVKEVAKTATVPSVQKTTTTVASVPSTQKSVVPSTSDTMQRTVVTPPTVARETASMVDRAKPETKSVTPIQEPKYVAPMPKNEPAPAVKSTVSEKTVIKPVAKPVTAAPATTASQDLYPDSIDTTKPFTVEPGMTMWSIAKLFKGDYPEATMDQLLVAFVRDNPKNFENGRVNGVRVGSTLRAPKASTVKRITVDEAWALVRVNPNADARKAPTKRDLTRAHQRMQKSAPALYKEVQVRLAQEKKTAQERQARAQAQKREAELKAQEAKKLEEAKAASIAQQNAPDHDPLAATIEATSRGESSATQQPNVETQPTPTPTTEVSAKDAATGVAPEAQPVQKNSETVVKAEPEKDSGLSATLIALIVGLVAVIAGAVVWLTNRNRQRRERDEEALKTVRFMKAEPATDDQLKAAESMVENRLEADRAAARGFNLEQQVAPKMEKPIQEVKTEPVLKTESISATDVAGETPVPTPPSAQSHQVTSGFNVASAYVAEEAGESPAPASNTTAARKLVDARNYIGVGGYDQALRACQDVLVTGSAQECEEARQLIAKIENLKAGS